LLILARYPVALSIVLYLFTGTKKHSGYIYIHTYIYTHIHTHTHIYINIYIHTIVNLGQVPRRALHRAVPIHRNKETLGLYIYIHIYTYIHTHTYIYIYMYIYI